MSEWTAERKQQLKALWATGLSSAAIGRQMNISKNAVVGMASRLLLPGRPSPIHRDKAKPCKPRKPARVGRDATLPTLAAPAPPPVVAPYAAAAAAPRVVAPPAPPEPLQPSISLKPRGGCVFPMWPSGTSGRPSFPVCNAPIARGSYCEVHAGRCYTQKFQPDPGYRPGQPTAPLSW